jgi:hypothetical protein
MLEKMGAEGQLSSIKKHAEMCAKSILSLQGDFLMKHCCGKEEDCNSVVSKGPEMTPKMLGQ